MKHQTWGGLINHLVKLQKLIVCTCKPVAHCNKQKHADPACPRGDYLESIRSIKKLAGTMGDELHTMKGQLASYASRLGVMQKTFEKSAIFGGLPASSRPN